MTMMKKLAIALGAFVAVVLGLAVTQPDTMFVERRIVIDAPPAKVFPWLEDPKKTSEWSPWDRKDPAMKKTYSGAPKGVGAVYEWDGNKEIGAGRLEITEVVPLKRVVMDLHFTRPMEGRNVAEYGLTPVAGGTEVSWSIRGPMPFVSKVMCVFMNMDKMIGGEFEKGLNDLKALAEKKA
jgi:uncharacterized protein YndB with AHSA1/START domain